MPTISKVHYSDVPLTGESGHPTVAGRRQYSDDRTNPKTEH